MRALYDTGAGRSGGGIALRTKIWSLVWDHAFEEGVEFLDCGGQLRLDLAAFVAVDCVAKLGAQFLDVLFDCHLRLLDVCERWNRRGGRTMSGQGSRQRPAEPARGGTDFVEARRRQNWRGRVTLRRHCPSATLADLSRQGCSLVWHHAEMPRQPRGWLEATAL